MIGGGRGTVAPAAGSGALLALATTAKTGSRVTAMVNGIPVSVEVARDVTVAAGDVLIVQRVGAQWFAVGRAFAAAPADSPTAPAPDPKPPSTSGSTPFAPVETRSYRNGSWRSDNDWVYQGQYGGQGNHTGCAFYGRGPRSLAGATVTAARIAVHRRSAGGITAPQSTTMRLVTQSTRPGGAPTLGASTSGPRLGWGATVTGFAVPTSWAQSMVDGTAGGLGFFVSGGSPYVIFAGRSEYGPAFTLTINWSR